jgi:hypothetical protein
MSGRQFSFVKPKIKVGSLAERRRDFEKIVKGADSSIATNTKGVVLSPEAKAEIKKGIASTLKKTSKLRDDIDKIKGTTKEYKAKGGRVGLKFGTGRKSNIQKIKETFGVKKKEKPKERMMAKKGSKPKKKFPDLTGDGKVTFADVLKGRGVINGKKKSKKKVV